MLIILFYFFIKGFNTKQSEISPLQSYIENCIQETATNSLILAGTEGGYTTKSNLSTRTNETYFLFEKKNYMPNKQFIEEQLSSYVKNNLNYCLNNLDGFADFTFEKGEISVKADIQENYTIFSVDYPLSVHKADKTYQLRYFESKVYVRLGVIYKVLRNYMVDQMEATEEVCISCIHNSALENGLYVELKDYDDKTVLFTVIDDKEKLREKDYQFVFVNNYDIKENEIV
jgi:hypothetical protein